jgi:hypothetical protein
MRTKMRTSAAPARAHHSRVTGSSVCQAQGAGFQSTRDPQAIAAQLCGARAKHCTTGRHPAAIGRHAAPAEGRLRQGRRDAQQCGAVRIARRVSTCADLPDLNVWLALALAIANGWRLLSFDRDFERFDGLQWLQPA